MKDELMAHATPAAQVQMEMPVFIRDYTDFYSSKNHAYNIGVMFRGPDNAL
jgi:fumarylacetoacetase